MSRSGESPWGVGELFERVKRLWADGLSAGQIARQLGNGFTRSAILGKLSREGVLRKKRQHTSPNQSRAQPRARPKTSQRLEVHPVEVRLPVASPATGGVPMLDLSSRACRWPLWDHKETGAPDFPHCGQHKTVGVYCEKHAVTAYGEANARAIRERKNGTAEVPKIVHSNRGMDGGW